MANNKNPNEKQPGENPEGKYHFNPGNMAGKKPGIRSRLPKAAAIRMRTKKNPPLGRVNEATKLANHRYKSQPRQAGKRLGCPEI